MEIFAERLKELRTERGLSLSGLGDKIGVSKTAVMYWESGKKIPSALVLKQLALFFSVSADYLLGLED